MFIYGELIHATITLIKGKVVKLDNLFLVRQGHSNQMFRKLHKNFFDWIIDSEWLKSYNLLEKITIVGLKNNYYNN